MHPATSNPTKGYMYHVLDSMYAEAERARAFEQSSMPRMHGVWSSVEVDKWRITGIGTANERAATNDKRTRGRDLKLQSVRKQRNRLVSDSTLSYYYRGDSSRVGRQHNGGSNGRAA